MVMTGVGISKMKTSDQAAFKKEYPLIYLIDAHVVVGPSMPYVPNAVLSLAVASLGPDVECAFNKMFGCHTAIADGLYPWDVERTLERMPRKLLK